MDWRYSAKIGVVFRVIAGLLTLLFLPFGIWGLISEIGKHGFDFGNSDFHFPLALLGWGFIFLVVAIRGRLVKKEP